MKTQVYSLQRSKSRRLTIIEILQLTEADTARLCSAFDRHQMRLTLRNNIDAERHWLSKAVTVGQREKCNNVINRLTKALKNIPS